MCQEITKWIEFFQGLIFTRFRQNQEQAIEVLTELIIGHLFGLYNLNQLADALGIPKSSMYEHISHWSLYQWKRLLLEIACQQATELIEQTESMSDATQSRRRITLSVDDTVAAAGWPGDCLLLPLVQWEISQSACWTEHPGYHHPDWRGRHSLGCTAGRQAGKSQYHETPTPCPDVFSRYRLLQESGD